jgi:hypothetical protein
VSRSIAKTDDRDRADNRRKENGARLSRPWRQASEFGWRSRYRAGV